jgi:hypothetical protein
MKIIQVNLGLLPIPPNGWGAVEKIIWDYYQLLNNKGLDCQIKYLNEIHYADDTIVHVHVANLANECHKRGIPYIFSLHDHHSYLYGKESDVYKENLQAIVQPNIWLIILAVRNYVTFLTRLTQMYSCAKIIKTM